MDHYFIGRERKTLTDLVKQGSTNKVELAYFVDEKIDDKVGEKVDDKFVLTHLIINNSTFSNIGFKKTKAQQCD